MERKTDRRTIYTCMVIKDAVLKLLEEKDFYYITIADICRKAEINRGTFYLHYSNISQVIDELLDEALSNIHPITRQIGIDEPSGDKCEYPLCRFIRENKQYQPLFFSDSLRGRAVAHMAANNKEDYIRRFKTNTNLSDKVIESIFYFQLNGCLAVSKQNISLSDSEWGEIQCGIDELLKGGFKGM